ncbi:hypothetical protein K466DRAFT_577621 [Polyporus arcularius HHB13444]|uniref:Uncharacterized protein n=1 Tax=Polyporus arcularius HHB13444 TaxID=1314778 RepID=A0A5C3P445_9APHY|nr:hypothetical protein K466DRAFT_577621 [Polyporus arcularius HHB13444]
MQPTSLAGLPEQLRPRPAPPQPVPIEIEPLRDPTPPPVPPPEPTNTRANRFGVFRQYYPSIPSRDPEEGLTINAFTDTRTHTRPPVTLKERDPVRPFGTRMKTPGELNKLIREVFLAPEYRREDLEGFDATRENQKLDKYLATSGAFSADDGWRQGSVEIRLIRLPKEGVSHSSEEVAPTFKVENVFTRSLLEVLKAGYQDARASRFHLFPFKLFWQRKPSSPGGPPPPPMRLWSDTYNSDEMIEEHNKLQEKARTDREPGDADDVEYAVAPLLLYSDSTHLASFGTAALWPIYSFFGALTKYIRCRPSAFAAHHIAYIPSLPATIQKAYQDIYGTPASTATLRLCKRDLMQQIWHLLLDEEFIKAYVHGILVKCACLIPKDNIDKMGTVNDMKNRTRLRRKLGDDRFVESTVRVARKKIFEQGLAPEGATVDDALKSTSITSSRSAFADKLAKHGLNVYALLVPDLMHEFELGVWKATFTHLVRVLIAAGGHRIQEMDKRFAAMPTFGRDTIRRLGPNISAMKKLAARDFEDILQCSYFVFEGLLDPPYNDYVLDLLFILATWHALAKLRLHSEETLTYLEDVTKKLGTAMRAFDRHVCAAFDTRELPTETVARQRRAAAKSAQAPTGTQASAAQPRGGKKTTPAKKKKFNRSTYKYHRLGDYAASIRRHGTTDNTSTQPGELEHKRVKRFYALTNKNVKFAWQIARLQRRQQYLHSKGPHVDPPLKKKPKKRSRARYVRVPLRAAEHIQISEEQANSVHIRELMGQNRDDPSFNDFHRMLIAHLFHRLEALAGRPITHEPIMDEFRSMRVEKELLFIHKVMRVNWTSYDMRREQSSVNPRTHPDIMMVAPPGSPHPYLYARVISIFHVNVFRLTPDAVEQPEPQLLQALWVRWFDLDTSRPGGFEHLRPHRLKFAHLDDEPFGFISPEQVLRDVHVVPAPFYGLSETPTLPHRVITRSKITAPAEADDEDDAVPQHNDWKYYYVAMWSDRDLFMRNLGGGVGHEYTHGDGEFQTAPMMPTHDEDMEVEAAAPASPQTPPAQEDEAASDEEEPEGAYEPSDVEGDDGDEDEDEEGDEGDDSDMEVDEGAQDPDDEDSEPDLGPEDGEGDDDVDDYEANRYAPY